MGLAAVELHKTALSVEAQQERLAEGEQDLTLMVLMETVLLKVEMGKTDMAAVEEARPQHQVVVALAVQAL
jgi:hypothetical protein